MKLLLTSTGLSTEQIENAFQWLLTKPAQENKAYIMGVDPNVPNFDMQRYINRHIKMLIEQGFTPTNITVYEFDKVSPRNLEDVDVLLMLGGNEYHYMSLLRKQGLDLEIRKFIENEGVYVGSSAGAIIMGPDIDIAQWSTGSNDLGLEDTSGFGYVDFITVPHIDTRKHPEKVLAFHKRTGYKMMYLTDRQAILVCDDRYKII